MNVLVFDIETVPDVEGGRRLYDLGEGDLDEGGMDDAAIAQAMFAIRKERSGQEMLKLHLQRIVAISAVYRSGSQFSVWSVGDEASSEKELIERFFAGVERYTPTLVSWNGSGFDLPVLNYRAMRHAVAAPRYWEMGREDQSFKWNNYISRYHFRHTDVMDILALYQARAYVPLDEMATLLGFPGKMGMSGAKVWETFLDGDLKSIRDYCETDVLNTYLVYLRFQLMRGELSAAGYQQETDVVKRYLEEQSNVGGTDSESREHLKLFLEKWLQDEQKVHVPWGS